MREIQVAGWNIQCAKQLNITLQRDRELRNLNLASAVGNYL